MCGGNGVVSVYHTSKYHQTYSKCLNISNTFLFLKISAINNVLETPMKCVVATVL